MAVSQASPRAYILPAIGCKTAPVPVIQQHANAALYLFAQTGELSPAFQPYVQQIPSPALGARRSHLDSVGQESAQRGCPDPLGSLNGTVWGAWPCSRLPMYLYACAPSGHAEIAEPDPKNGQGLKGPVQKLLVPI